MMKSASFALLLAAFALPVGISTAGVAHAAEPAQKPAAKPVPAKPKDAGPKEAEKLPATPPRLEPGEVALAPDGDWRINAVADKDGKFSYCAAEAHFQSGHDLVIGRNPQGEFNIAVTVPGARLPVHDRWPVTLATETTPPREGVALALRSDLLVVAQGKDEAWFTRLASDHLLFLASASDRIVFTLKETGKAFAEAKDCADKKGDGFTKARAESPAEGFPAALSGLLNEAGLTGFTPIDFGDLPASRRPADYAWRWGEITGGLREREVVADATLFGLAGAAISALSQRCVEPAKSGFSDSETLVNAVLRIGTIECRTADGPVHVALLFYLTRSNLFSTFFLEAPPAATDKADQARDKIAAIVRRRASSTAP